MSGRILIILGTGAVVLAAGAAMLFMAQPSPPAASSPETAQPRMAADEPTAPPRAPEPERPTAPAGREAPAAPTPAVEAAPTVGTLHVDSDVPDTSVFVDRVFLGTAPVTKTDLAPGSHVVLLSPTGYESQSKTVDLVAGEERRVAVSFKTITLDAAIAVVHKHAFGSCEGTLRATPEGLTYDTANKSDRFTVPLTGLDAFEVDYLEKNLKVKIRNGKTFNFTDPDGNADRLFVFHRDVEKVRQRLAEGR